jgi:transcriptional regulator with XRE-family HTH domain
MKRLQCTNCRQIFWKDLDIDESQVGGGDWVQNRCPKCGSDWAVVEPAAGKGGARRGKKAKTGAARPARRTKPAAAGAGKAAGFSSAAIRKLRKKLGVSQKKLASLVGVSTGTVVAWEAGKFSPRKNKIEELADLGNWEKEDIKNLDAEKAPPPAEGKEAPQAKAKGKKRQPAKKKPVVARKKKAAQKAE